MLPRTLETEVMDTQAEAVDYDAMDHSAVNRVFVDDFLNVWERSTAGKSTAANIKVLDVGTGTALIPIELCRRRSGFHVVAVDLAAEMLRVATRNISKSGLSERILPQQVDAKRLPFADGAFDAVISNSIVHHIPEPRTVLAEMLRVLRPGCLLFVRDLLRPADSSTVDQLVATYAGDANRHQQQMFRDSLHAALTLAEIRELLQSLGVPPESVQQTTDRHWTIVARCARAGEGRATRRGSSQAGEQESKSD